MKRIFSLLLVLVLALGFSVSSVYAYTKSSTSSCPYVITADNVIFTAPAGSSVITSDLLDGLHVMDKNGNNVDNKMLGSLRFTFTQPPDPRTVANATAYINTITKEEGLANTIDHTIFYYTVTIDGYSDSPVLNAEFQYSSTEDRTDEDDDSGSETPVRVPYVFDMIYSTHVQNVGWQTPVFNSKMSGTEGRCLRLEAINIDLGTATLLTNNNVSVKYRTHVQNYGWQGWVGEGKDSGTSGEGLRLEAIQIELTGEDANFYDVYYRVHAQNFGWLGWAKNGEEAGTAGYGYRLEGIEIFAVEAGSNVPVGYGAPAFISTK